MLKCRSQQLIALALQPTRFDGKGLNNFLSRAIEMNVSVNIGSNVHRGTQTQLNVPFASHHD